MAQNVLSAVLACCSAYLAIPHVRSLYEEPITAHCSGEVKVGRNRNLDPGGHAVSRQALKSWLIKVHTST